MPAHLDLQVTLLGKELRAVLPGWAKDLEVHMDATLSFDDHIRSISSSCSSSLCQLNRVKHLLDTNTVLKTLSMNKSLANSTTVLVNGGARAGRFYLLPKLHKRGCPGRPVISGCNTPTEKISAFVDHHLKPLVAAVPSYVKDTNDF